MAKGQYRHPSSHPVDGKSAREVVDSLGTGRFYTGQFELAVLQLVVSICTLGFGARWGFIDGVLILVNGGTDAEGRPLRD